MISKHVLLTGAGFTHNFGTPLADEMWGAIFNNKHIQAEHRIKDEMKSNSNLDYEDIYNCIKNDINVKYTKNEKKAFENSVNSVYKNIDSIIIDFIRGGGNYPIIHKIREMISLFSNKNKKSFIFTLNQDLFIERFYRSNPNKSWRKLIIPGIENKSNWFSDDFLKPLEPSDYCTLPNKVELNANPDSLDGNFFYVKLHSSYNWMSSNGKHQMVYGKSKADQIENELLLKFYSEIFKNVLFQPKQRLFIIGYGFGDEHINEIIANAVKNHGLELFIFSPMSPEDFRKVLFDKQNHADDIWKGLSGYYPYKLTDIIQAVGLYSYQYTNIFNDYFEKEIIIR